MTNLNTILEILRHHISKKNCEDLMDKLDKFLHRFFSLIDGLIVLSGGILGGYVTWLILSTSEFSVFAKMSTTALIALVCMVLTALLWKLMNILN